MTTSNLRPWTGGWTAENPIQIGFAWAPKDGGEWQLDECDGVEYRELGVEAASDGAFGVRHLRVAEDGDGTANQEWRAHDLDFDFLYVLSGSATLEDGNGESVNFSAGGAAVLAPLLSHRRVDVSADFEAVHITAPASFKTLSRPGTVSSGGTSNDAQGARGHYTHDTPDRYERGNGPRAYFLYRDLGARAYTGDRVHIHVVRATEPGEGTGWHYHTMAQWFMIVGGASNIGVEDHPTQPLRVGDAMCVGYGEHMRHNVAPFTGDYAVLEMCVPADYDTIAVERPEGATL